MSKFRCEVDVSFNSEADAIAFFNLVESWKDKVAPATESHGPQDIAIITRARYHECFHDEVPPKPCGAYVDVDFSDPVVVEHKTTDDKVMVVSADNTKAYTKTELSSDVGKIDAAEIKP